MPCFPHSAFRTPHLRRAAPVARGLSLVELLIALAITAMLLTATMVAIDASFHAYAAAAESASTQTATRMTIHRLLTLVRTGTAHGPLIDSDPTDGDWPVIRQALDDALQASYGINAPTHTYTIVGETVECSYLRLNDSRGNDVLLEYIDAVDELWLTTLPYDGGAALSQPLLGGVTSAKFFATRRFDRDGVLVLERGSIDLTVEADTDNTLAIDDGDTPPIRVIASTMPRKLD